MELPDVIACPDPRLRQKSVAVTAVDAGMRELMDQMRDLVLAQKALGLAAIQIGRNLRVAVVNVAVGDGPPSLYHLVNPKITWRSAQKVMSEESCLSVPGRVDVIVRAQEVVVRHLDYNGKTCDLRARGLLAVCIQHEIDHMDGVLFTDHLPLTQRLALRWHEMVTQWRSRGRHNPQPVIN